MSATPKDDRRRFTRVNFDARATLVQGDNTYKTHLVDISLNGVLVGTPEHYEITTELPTNIHINLADNTTIHMNVHLAHSSSEVLGFKCESIDMDSIAHLRRLIELNIDDPRASERVLNELLTPH